MFTAYHELEDTIDISKITKITLGKVELEKEATFELMKEIATEDIFNNIVFWTKDSRIDKTIDYDCYDYGEECFKETKLQQKTQIKVTPESLKDLWKDPETRMDLPLKTKAYLEEEKKKEEKRQKEIKENNKKNYERIKNLIETQLEETEKFEFKPFTIIKGSRYNDCRYITLPKDFPTPNNDYYLNTTNFYRSMAKTTKYVDFIGLAGIKNNKPYILGRYALNSLQDTKDLKALVNKAISENKFTPVLGISQEIIGGRNLDEIIQEIKKELEHKQNSNK